MSSKLFSVLSSFIINPFSYKWGYVTELQDQLKNLFNILAVKSTMGMIFA